MKIFVGNLSFKTEEPAIEALFAPLGTVNSVQLVRDRETGRSRGFAFVEMPDDEEGRKACEALNQREFEGRRLNVNEARPQERRGGGGFGRSEGGGGGYGRGGGFGRDKRDARW
jgi:RNA recognition motif-containing protein